MDDLLLDDSPTQWQQCGSSARSAQEVENVSADHESLIMKLASDKKEAKERALRIEAEATSLLVEQQRAP